MVSSSTEGRTLFSLPGSWISVAHTIGALGAFLTALVVGSLLHFHKIVQNEWFGYPQEWFPSVSATIGDRYPERNLFQLIMAVTAPPRFLLLLLLFLLHRKQNPFLSSLVCIVGLARTFTAGGWIYITSTDAHDWHDIFMISYLVLTIPWMFGNIAISQRFTIQRKRRINVATAFFGVIPPLIYFFIQHKIHQIPGAYTIYSFFEWSLIFSDVFFDAVSFYEFRYLELKIVENSSVSGIYISPLRNLSSAAAKEKDKNVLTDNETGRLRQLISFTSDIYLSFIFWTTITALGPSIWHFSVWGMGLAGQEAFLFANLSPFVLLIPGLWKLASKTTTLLHILSLIGLLGYHFESPILRLQCVAAGVFLTCIVYCVRWANSARRNEEINENALTFGLGLVLTLVVKYACYSLNPGWPVMNHTNGGYNSLIIMLALGSILESSVRPQLPTLTNKVSVANKPSSSANTLMSAAGFGSLIFLIHTLFTDSGIIIAWVWTGYPIKGPIAVPNATLVITAISAGLYTSSFDRLVTNPLWYLAGWASVSVLHSVENWSGFVGGLLFAVFVFSLLPRFIRLASQTRRPAVTFGVAWLFYNFLVLAGVWTVAYAFVPGGNYLRERTDLVILASMIMIGAGFWNASKFESITKAVQSRSRQAVEYSRTLTKYCLVLSVCASGIIALARARSSVIPAPFHPEDRTFTAGIWTVHFAMDNNMWDSQRRMANLFADAELDVVGLLESDLYHIVMGNRDIAQYASETLGYYADIGPGPNKHTWGCALLSKFPIINSTHHLLPSPVGELAPAIHATLDVYGTYVDVIVSHNGQEEDPVDRRMQSEVLGEIMKNAYPRPFVFLGYVVTKPQAAKPAPYWYLVEDGKMIDVDASDWDRWCEYILFRGLHRAAYARITRGGGGGLPAITDTELQIAKFSVPAEPIDPDVDSLPKQIHESQAPASHKVPGVFNGAGVRGHRFHVLDGGKARYYTES